MARPRVHDDALRGRLLEVASEAISARGTGALTVRDVAARAGTSASAVYALFGGRDELVRAVGDEAFRRFAVHLATVGASSDPGADLLALGIAYRKSALADPHFYRVMFDTAAAGAQDPGRGPTTAEPTFLVLRDAVARLLAAAGRPGGPGADAIAVAVAREIAVDLWGLVHGLVGLELAGLLPGTTHERAARYERALRAAGSSTFAPPAFAAPS